MAFWFSLGEHQKAIGYYEQALAAFEKRLGKNHPNTKVVSDNLADVKRQLANSATH